MIVPMHKVYAAVRSEDRDRLLGRLRELGVVHLVPVDPVAARADAKTLERVRDIERATQILSSISPIGQPPEEPPDDLAQTVLDLQQNAMEHRSRHAALTGRLERMSVWGDVKLEQFDELRHGGIDVRIYRVPDAVVDRIEAECVHTITSLPGRRSLVAVVDRQHTPQMPEGAVRVPLPQHDTPSIRAELAEVELATDRDAAMLGRLAHLIPELDLRKLQLQQEIDYRGALLGGLDTNDLLAVQGWLPVERSDSLEANILGSGIEAAVRISEPSAEDEPPTLIRYPRWATPIRGLFRILGTVAGYREFDVSAPFMIALPIFAAMLISDGGYGAILFFVPLIGFRKISAKLGADFTRLLIIVGAVAMIWGGLTASFFGWTPPYPPLFSIDQSVQSRDLVMRISFVMGAIHLSLAQLWQAAVLYPDLRMVGKIGWGVFLWGMLGVVMKYVLGAELTWHTPWPYLLIAGAVLAVLFYQPRRGILRSIGLGLASFPLSLLSAFSDVISYVRLMAVGLASSVLASQFNLMAMNLDFLPATVLILVFGHALNLGLALIALFAHGVRLNMLEFSNNLGIQWTGHAYNPFRARTAQENIS